MKIVDLSCDVAGRFAAKLLAMSGLEVIRPLLRDQRSLSNRPDPLTLYLDAGKRIVSCSDARIAPDLLTNADVVFTSFDRGRHLGLASELMPFPPHSIHVTTSTFGTWGPYSSLRGGPLAEWSAGGYLAITGDPEREPLIGPEHLCSYIGGYTAAFAAEAALHERRRSGQGQHIDVSTMESMLCLHQSTFSRAGVGFVRQRTGRYAEVYPLVVRPCKGGFVSLAVVTDAEFDRLLIAIDRTDLVSDERFHDREARWKNRDALDQELDLFLRRYNAHDAVDILQANGVAAAKVVEPTQILANPQFAHRGFWAHPEGVSGGRMPGNPIPSATIFSASGGQRAKTSSHGTAASLPLAGTLVLDLTAFWAGPSATRCLADLGAEVIWVERPRSRTDLDPLAADPKALVQHLYHAKMNRNKRSIVLDLDTENGRGIARRLALEVDVLVENFRPGTADRLGLGARELCTANPKLVYVSLSGFGSSGPWGAWRSYGPNIEAESSMLARTGYLGGEPMRLGHALPDGVGGIAGALAALRGLREREDQGSGGWFDISQLEVYTAVCGEDITAASLYGWSCSRIGNRSRYGAIQGVFSCRGNDQWVAIRLADSHDVVRFAETTNSPAIVQLAAATPRDYDVIEKLIGSYTSSRDKHAVASALQDVGLEALPVLTSLELLNDPHLRERGFFVSVEVSGHRFALPGSPIHASRGLSEPNGLGPRFGEHTAAVLARLNTLRGD